MKVEVNSQALADAVAWTTRVIDARPATPILAGIRLEAIDGTLQLSAFNYAISARHHIEAGVDEAGSVLVLGKLLADITKSLPTAKTYLSTDGSTMTITSGKSTFTMQLMPESEYPDLPWCRRNWVRWTPPPSLRPSTRRPSRSPVRRTVRCSPASASSSRATRSS